MNQFEIRQALRTQKKSASTIARVLGVSPALMTQAMQGRGSEIARIKIAFTLCKPPSHIWVHASRRQNLIDDDIYYHLSLYPEYADKTFLFPSSINIKAVHNEGKVCDI